MKKNDFILIFSILIIALLLFWVRVVMVDNEAKEKVFIYQGDKIIQELNLTEEKEITINASNTLSIQSGKVDMLEANCPDKLCVQQKSISKKGETIICLPNQIIVEIK